MCGSAGIAANLSWMDPFNLILLFFFKEGMLKVLACILNPIPVRDRVRRYYRPMSSIMFGAIPDIVREGIMKFNGRVVDLFFEFQRFPGHLFISFTVRNSNRRK